MRATPLSQRVLTQKKTTTTTTKTDREEREMVGPERPRIVLFGSSIVQFSFGNGGWGAVLAHLYSRQADVVVRGYAGWNSRRALQVLHKVFPKDALVQPALVIVYFGGNDSVHPHPSGLGPHVPLPEYVSNMRKIAAHIQSLSETTRLIFLSAPPVNEQLLQSQSHLGQMVRTNKSCRIYSEACLQLCREMDIKAVDLWSTIQLRDDWRTACLTDGIHFTAEGSELVVQQILKVIREADWKPSLYWTRMPIEFDEDSCYDPIGPDGVPRNFCDSIEDEWESSSSKL